MYLLKGRAHVLDVMKEFFKEIKTKFSTSTHLFRMDNALEYVQFCASLGILHQTSVHIHLNRMELLNVNIVISLMLPVLL